MPDDRLRFHRVKAPAKAELETLVHRLSERIGSHLDRHTEPTRAVNAHPARASSHEYARYTSYSRR